MVAARKEGQRSRPAASWPSNRQRPTPTIRAIEVRTSTGASALSMDSSLDLAEGASALPSRITRPTALQVFENPFLLENGDARPSTAASGSAARREHHVGHPSPTSPGRGEPGRQGPRLVRKGAGGESPPPPP